MMAFRTALGNVLPDLNPHLLMVAKASSCSVCQGWPNVYLDPMIAPCAAPNPPAPVHPEGVGWHASFDPVAAWVSSGLHPSP